MATPYPAFVKSIRQKASWHIGRVFSVFFSAACGLGVAGAGAMIFTGPFGAVIALLLAVCTTFINWKLSKRKVPEIFARLFGKSWPGYGLVKGDEGGNTAETYSHIPKFNRFMLALSTTFCLLGGIVAAGMNYGTMMTGLAAMGLGLLASPFIVIPLLSFLAITVSFLMLSGYATLLKIRKPFVRAKNELLGMLNPNHKLYTAWLKDPKGNPHVPGIFKLYQALGIKGETELRVAGFVALAFVTVAIGLVLLGLGLQIFTGAIGLERAITDGISAISKGLAATTAMTLSIVAFIGQIPFFLLQAFSAGQTLGKPFMLWGKSAKDWAYRIVYKANDGKRPDDAPLWKRAATLGLGLLSFVAIVPAVIQGIETAKANRVVAKAEKAEKAKRRAEKGKPTLKEPGILASIGYKCLQFLNAVSNGLFSYLGGSANNSPMPVIIIGTVGGTAASFSAAEPTDADATSQKTSGTGAPQYAGYTDRGSSYGTMGNVIPKTPNRNNNNVNDASNNEDDVLLEARNVNDLVYEQHHEQIQEEQNPNPSNNVSDDSSNRKSFCKVS